MTRWWKGARKKYDTAFRSLLRILNTYQTNCGDCDPLVWLTPTNNVRMNPPENTVVVVDVRGNQGAIRIVDKKDNKYVDGIGTEETRKLVMVPWNSNWWYYTIGSIRVAYIGKKS